MEVAETPTRAGRGRRARYGDAVVPKSITFKRKTLQRLTDLAQAESRGNLSECVNDLVEEALASRAAEAAIDAMATAAGVHITETDVQRATEWLLQIRHRVDERRAGRIPT